MFVSMLSMWLRASWSRERAMIAAVGVVALVVGVVLAMQAGLTPVEVTNAGEIGSEFDGVTTSGEETTSKTGP